MPSVAEAVITAVIVGLALVAAFTVGLLVARRLWGP